VISMLGLVKLTNLDERIVGVFLIKPIGKERDYCVDRRHVEDS
jgi:hypothetical protein